MRLAIEVRFNAISILLLQRFCINYGIATIDLFVWQVHIIHKSGAPTQILESREKKWILIGLLRSVPEKSSLNLTLYIEIALVHSVCLLIIPNVKTPKKT